MKVAVFMTGPIGRLTLRPLSSEDAQSILQGITLSAQRWARDYPTFVDSDLLRALVHNTPYGVSTTAFGQYQIELQVNNLVIGGAGFVGPPDEFNAVEISFGIVPDYGGCGYGEEVVSGLVNIARTHCATFVIASTKPADLARQSAFTNGGLHEIVRDDIAVHFAVDLRE